MIVFYFILFIILAISIFFISSISINTQIMELKENWKIKRIYESFVNKKYDEIFKYLNIKVNIKLVILFIIPIQIYKADNTKIRKIVKKIMDKNMKLKNKNKEKYKEKMKKQKIKTKKIIKNMIPCLNLKNAEINIGISLNNLGVTALIVSILNIIISTILGEVVTSQDSYKSEDNLINNIKKIQYKVCPIYTNDFRLYFDSKMYFIIPIFSTLYELIKKA